MATCKYLIVGAGHAGLSAIEAIRRLDPEGSIILFNREAGLPYSPTILPYVVTGQVDPRNIFLRDHEKFQRLNVEYRPDGALAALKPGSRTATLSSGESLPYEKILLATGAAPALPPVPGLEHTRFHVLRTLQDALRLRKAAAKTAAALVIGAGLIGMHAAESLFRVGMKVTVVEHLSRVLPGYFDEEASGIIQRIFESEGVRFLTGKRITHASVSKGRILAVLDSGSELSADVLVVAAGVRPSMEYLTDSGIDVEQGILVDRRMRTSAEAVWAAGDVAQAPDFYGPERKLNATLPNAVEQGRIAGMDMVGDPALKPYTGSIPVNTYRFFGNRAFSVGWTSSPLPRQHAKTVKTASSTGYRKFVFEEDRLIGTLGINTDLDPGILSEMIKRRIGLSDLETRFNLLPLETGRILMTRTWR